MVERLIFKLGAGGQTPETVAVAEFQIVIARFYELSSIEDSEYKLANYMKR